MKDSQSLKKKNPKVKKRTFKKTKPVTSGMKEPKGRNAAHGGNRFFRPFQYVQSPVIVANKATKSQRSQRNLISLLQHETDVLFLLIPLVLLTIFVLLATINIYTQKKLQEHSFSTDETITELNPYPFVESVEAPVVSAKAALILDADSQVIVFSKNPQLRFSMASTTKIMTALVALEHFQPNDILTVQSFGTEGSGLGLTIGEQFTLDDLLYMMMLPSANDAAVTIADNYPGGRAAFVSKMNEKAQELHLTNTHFADPAGLEDDGDYTTVVDLARLASAAIANERFAEIVATRSKVVSNQSYTRSYPLENLNKLLGTNGITGIKTGTTEGAGQVLVTSADVDDHTYIIIVMNSTQRFVDTLTLLSYLTDNVQYVLPTVPIRQQ